MTYDEFQEECYICELTKYVPDEETYNTFYRKDIIKGQEEMMEMLMSLYEKTIIQCIIELDCKYKLDNAIHMMLERICLEKIPNNFNDVVKKDVIVKNDGNLKITYSLKD